MNTRADDLALLLRVGDAGERVQEALARVDVHEVHAASDRANMRDDVLGLVLAQQAVVDEDAGELVADRAMHEHRRDRRIDAARERRRSRGPSPTCSRIALDGLVDEVRRRPVGREPRDVEQEAAEDLVAALGVCATSGWNCMP